MRDDQFDNLPTFGISRCADSLDSGWITLPNPYLLYAKTGSLSLEIQDRLWILPPQRAAWIPPNTQIRIQASRPIESASILFSTSSGVASPPTCRVFSVSPMGREMIIYAMRWTQDRDPNDVAADRFFQAIADVCHELAREPDRLWLPLARTSLLKKAIDHVLAHLSERLTTESIAQSVHCTARTLSRTFASEATMTLGQFIQRARVLRAMEFLAQSDLTVLEIVFAVGLNSVGSFEVAFRKLVQESPLQYRKRFNPGSKGLRS